MNDNWDEARHQYIRTEGVHPTWVAHDDTVVHLTGNESVAGTKTFSSNVPTTAPIPTDNSHLTRKDYVDAIGKYRSYAPTWTATVTNPNPGSGIVAGAYYVSGNIMHIDVGVVIETDTTYGSGIYGLSLPTGYTYSSEFPLMIGNAIVYDFITDAYLSGWCQYHPSTQKLRAYLPSATPNKYDVSLKHNDPIAWHAGHRFLLTAHVRATKI